MTNFCITAVNINFRRSITLAERVALIGENSIEYVEIILNVWSNENCIVLFDYNIPYLKLIEMMNEANVTTCYVEHKYFERFPCDNIINEIKFIVYESQNQTAKLLPQSVYDNFAPNYSYNEAVILYSSGTTGTSKGIILSHYAINTNADSIIEYMDLTDNDRMYALKNFSHSSAFTGELLVALKRKIKLLVSQTALLPRLVFRNIIDYGVTVICLNPSLLNFYSEAFSKVQYEINTLKTIYVSGAILSDNDRQCAKNTFENVNIFNAYGLTEAGPRVTAQTINTKSYNSVGVPINGVEVVVVNEDGSICEKYKKGVVHVNTHSKYTGYVTGDIKHPSLYCGWLNTGDVGYFDKNNELHITDRFDDMIIIEAHKVYPSEIQECICRISGIKECLVVSMDYNNRQILACIYVGSEDISQRIKNQLKNYLASYEIPKLFVKADAIIRNNRGKIDVKSNINYVKEKIKEQK